MIAPMGGPLNAADFEALAARWIDPQTAKQQLLRRVHAIDGSSQTQTERNRCHHQSD